MSSFGLDMSKFPPGWDFSNCTEVGPLCPVEVTMYGYIPNLAANGIYAAAFAICGILTLLIGLFKRTWSFSLLVGIALGLEAIGYLARVKLHKNVFDKDATSLQLVALILAPTLFCAAMYLTLKHMALAVGPHISRIRPRLLTPLFLCSDIGCLFMQGVGAVIAAGGANKHPVDMDKVKLGENLMIAGVVLQVVVLTIFGLCFADFCFGARRYYRGDPARRDEIGYANWTERRFRRFLFAIITAYTLIWIRCVYRIVELAQGWANPIMRDELSFIFLEGLMVVLAAIIVTLFPPGVLFPQMGKKGHTNPKALNFEAQSSTELLPQNQQPPRYPQQGYQYRRQQYQANYGPGHGQQYRPYQGRG